MNATAPRPDYPWQFDHLSVNAPAQDPAIDALVKILGLKPGFRPPFPFSGRWFYRGDDAILHVIDEQAEGLAPRLKHLAFQADAPVGAVMARVIETRLPYRIGRVPASQTIQIFVRVADSLLIELDVPARPDDPPIAEYRQPSDAPNLEKPR